jgi:hypothetical protein
MVGSPSELCRKPRSVSSWWSSASADTLTRGAPNVIPAQTAESSIHAASLMTTPRATAT